MTMATQVGILNSVLSAIHDLTWIAKVDNLEKSMHNTSTEKNKVENIKIKQKTYFYYAFPRLS